MEIKKNLHTNDLHNQSFNEMNFRREFVSNIKETWLDTLKNVSLPGIFCLLIFPITIIIIGMIYRDDCLADPYMPLFLIIFGILILINLLIYSRTRATFIALIKRLRSCSWEDGSGILFLGLLIGSLVFSWWIVGIVWWIKLTMNIQPQLTNLATFVFCHPIIYWTTFLAIVVGLIGFIMQIYIAINRSNDELMLRRK